VATVPELRKLYEEEHALRLKLDELVGEAYYVLVAAKEHYSHGREGEASILVDAAHRILGTHVED